MHEDIDDFEPDLNAYYGMHPDEKKLRKEKYYWYKKYSDGKISNGRYIKGLEEDFYEILDTEDRKEIDEFNKEQKQKKEKELEKKAIENYRRQKESEELNKKIGCIFGIIMLIVFLMGLLS